MCRANLVNLDNLPENLIDHNKRAITKCINIKIWGK